MDGNTTRVENIGGAPIVSNIPTNRSPFLLSPSHLNKNQSINYFNRPGIKIYLDSIALLWDTLYNGIVENVNQFCHKLLNKYSLKIWNCGDRDIDNITNRINSNIPKDRIFQNQALENMGSSPRLLLHSHSIVCRNKILLCRH